MVYGWRFVKSGHTLPAYVKLCVPCARLLPPGDLTPVSQFPDVPRHGGVVVRDELRDGHTTKTIMG